MKATITWISIDLKKIKQIVYFCTYKVFYYLPPQKNDFGKKKIPATL